MNNRLVCVVGGILLAGTGIYLAHRMWHYGRGETN